MATTKDGWSISTVDQEGAYAGLEMGRVWLRDPDVRGASRWEVYTFPEVGEATEAARDAEEMTKNEFDDYHAAGGPSAGEDDAAAAPL